jgi:hypothetical protein
MPNLRALNLNTAAITDDDLEMVGRLAALEDLDISTTDVTDAGLLRLADHQRLEMLVISDELAGGRFSHAALAEVQRRLPDCEIVVVGRGTFPRI